MASATLTLHLFAYAHVSAARLAPNQQKALNTLAARLALLKEYKIDLTTVIQPQHCSRATKQQKWQLIGCWNKMIQEG